MNDRTKDARIAQMMRGAPRGRWGASSWWCRKRAARRLRAAEENERQARREAHAKEDAAYQTFLDTHAGIMNAWDGKRDRFRQAEKLGGIGAARDAFRAWRAKVGE